MKLLMSIGVALLLVPLGVGAQHRGLPDYNDFENWEHKTGAYTIEKCNFCGMPMYRKDGIVRDSIVCSGKVYRTEGKKFFFHTKSCQLRYEKQYCKRK